MMYSRLLSLNGMTTAMEWMIMFLSMCTIVLSFGNNVLGSKVINSWSQRTDDSAMKLACYLSVHPGDLNTSLTNYLDPALCTHIMYFGSSISSDCEISGPLSPEIVTYLQNLKKKNPALKILNTNSGNFSPVLGSANNRTRFVNSVVSYLRKYGFDGIDFDWEYPGWEGKPYGQVHNFSLILEETRHVFKMEALMTNTDNLMITMAVTGWRILMDVLYEYEYIERNVDFVSLMGYDYNGFSKGTPFTGYNSPLFGTPHEIFFLKDRYLVWSANEWAKKLPKEKVLVGAPAYTKAYTLADPSKHGNRDPALAPGNCDGAHLVCACEALQKMNGTRVFDNTTKVPYIYYKDQWITYEDIQSISIKAKWVKENKFAGMMLFILNSDDVDAVCDGKTRFPLTSTIRGILFNDKR